jgi:predicted pyridoxine 5'-phosphate oxidase superfamily flavin-nucleotide-binding protein
LDQIKRADFEERRQILGLCVERARFLAACSHNDDGTGNPRHDCKKEKTIPYDDLPLLLEAHRLGIGLKDTADMFGWDVAKLKTYGIPFRAHSIIKKASGNRCYTLFQPENEQTNTIRRSRGRTRR